VDIRLATGAPDDIPAGENRARIAAVAENPTGKTYRDYPEWDLLPKGPDLDDMAEINRFQWLIDQGESVWEAMMAIVRECDEPVIASRALSVLLESKGDKRGVVADLKELMTKRLPRADGDEMWLMIDMAKAIAEMGGDEDVDILIPMLDHPRWEVRVNGARFLGWRGGEKALEALERAKIQPQNQGRTEKNAIEESISAIEKRLEKEAE